MDGIQYQIISDCTRVLVRGQQKLLRLGSYRHPVRFIKILTINTSQYNEDIYVQREELN